MDIWRTEAIYDMYDVTKAASKLRTKGYTFDICIINSQHANRLEHNKIKALCLDFIKECSYPPLFTEVDGHSLRYNYVQKNPVHKTRGNKIIKEFNINFYHQGHFYGESQWNHILLSLLHHCLETKVTRIAIL